MMAKYCVIGGTNPIGGREEEFYRWYEAVHLRDVLKVSGTLNARLYRAVGNAKYKYFAIVELDTDDPVAVLAELSARGGTPDMELTDALNMSDISVAPYQLIVTRGKNDHASTRA